MPIQRIVRTARVVELRLPDDRYGKYDLPAGEHVLTMMYVDPFGRWEVCYAPDGLLYGLQPQIWNGLARQEPMNIQFPTPNPAEVTQ